MARFYNTAPRDYVEGTAYEPPIEEMLKAIQAADERVQDTANQSFALYNIPVEAMPQEAEAAQTYIKGIQNEVDNLTYRFMANPEDPQAFRDLNTLKKKVIYDVNTGDVKRFNTNAASWKTYQDTLAKTDPITQDLYKGLDYSDPKYYNESKNFVAPTIYPTMDLGRAFGDNALKYLKPETDKYGNVTMSTEKLGGAWDDMLKSTDFYEPLRQRQLLSQNSPHKETYFILDENGDFLDFDRRANSSYTRGLRAAEEMAYKEYKNKNTKYYSGGGGSGGGGGSTTNWTNEVTNIGGHRHPAVMWKDYGYIALQNLLKDYGITVNDKGITYKDKDGKDVVIANMSNLQPANNDFRKSWDNYMNLINTIKNILPSNAGKEIIEVLDSFIDNTFAEGELANASIDNVSSVSASIKDYLKSNADYIVAFPDRTGMPITIKGTNGKITNLSQLQNVEIDLTYSFGAKKIKRGNSKGETVDKNDIRPIQSYQLDSSKTMYNIVYGKNKELDVNLSVARVPIKLILEYDEAKNEKEVIHSFVEVNFKDMTGLDFNKIIRYKNKLEH